MPYLNVPSLVLLDPFFTTSLSFLLQKYFPRDTIAYSSKSAISSYVDMVPSCTIIKGSGWEVSRMGSSIMRGGIMVEGVEIIGGRSEEIGVGICIENSGEEIVGMRGVSS